MGLDKWIKPEETKTKTIKKKDEGDPKKKSDTKPKGKQIDKELSKLTKFDLTCKNAKCKYEIVNDSMANIVICLISKNDVKLKIKKADTVVKKPNNTSRL